MQEKIIKLTAFYTSIFAVAVVLAMIVYQVKKPQIQMVEAGYQTEIRNNAETARTTKTGNAGIVTGTRLAVAENTVHDNAFHLLLNEKLQNQDESAVSVDVDYVNKMVMLTLQDISKNELEDCQLLADPLVVVCEEVSAVSIEGSTAGCIVRIPETKFASCQLQLTPEEIIVNFSELRPSSTCTVVIDAGHGGEDTGTVLGELQEKDVTLGVIEQLQPMLAQEENMRVFYTRTTDTTTGDEDRTAFANAIKADMLISIHVRLEPAEGNDLKAYYNDKYFIPEFGSVELANVLEEEVIQKIGGTATGLYAAEADDAFIATARVPVAKLEVGSMCTDNDLAIMKTLAYQKQIAEGLYAGINRAYEQMITVQSDLQQQIQAE